MTEKLYIIGNGFDIHHELKTSYADFRDNYAMKMQVIRDPLLAIFGDEIYKDMWWWNFEEMLGKIDYAHLMNTNNGVALGPSKLRNFLINTLPSFFGEWISTVDIKIQPDKSLKIDQDAKFFTFNYTMLLEEVYKVDDHNVWHIHNSIRAFHQGINPIVGHDSNGGQLIAYLSECRKNSEIRFDIADTMNQEIENAAKKVKNRIRINDERFSSFYSDIKQYVCMGFSFNEIDKPYIEKIAEVNTSFSTAKWILYWHSDGEDERMVNRLHDLGVNKSNITTHRW